MDGRTESNFGPDGGWVENEFPFNSSIVWKFPLPMPESFMRNEEIRKKLIKIAKGEGDIPLFVAADMNRESCIQVLC